MRSLCVQIGNDFEAVSQLEAAMEEWSHMVAGVVEAENSKKLKVS
jgi:hypothetical protein